MSRQARIIVTQKDSAYKLTEIEPLEFKKDPELENKAVNIYPEIQFQEITGFGGAVTESVHDTITRLSEANRQKILQLYFDKDQGIGYELIRTHLNSCDFSLGNYAYVKEGDRELKSFDLSRDIDGMFRTILTAQKIAGKNTKVLVSPWSPPAFMKTSGQMNHGGKLRDDCKRLWAEYIAKYLKETRKLGINVWAMTIQNEPKAVQVWDSCIYTALDEAEFIKEYLIPVFREQGIDCKVLIWDHNKERILERAMDTLADPEVRKFVWGVAFHWYSGDHFEAVELTHQLFPEKALMMSEGCMEKRIYAQEAWSHGEHYAHDIIGNLNSHMSGYFDWNMLLDERGGPNHVNNFCSAPIMADTINDKVHLNASYYYIGHFSKYIPPGSKRIGYSKYNKSLEVTAFQTPEGKTVVVMMNPTDQHLEVNLRQRDDILPLIINAHSIITVLY